MSAFDRLPEDLQNALHAQGILEPTPVQQAALPPALGGKDILATAQTGTGKTLAFVLPLLVALRERPEAAALVLSPTRELAAQIQETVQSLTPQEKEFFSVLIIGGDNIHKQYALLRRKARIIIGTPGRIIDHIGRKSLSLKNIAFLVLDEADRMLDMGFIPDVRRIVSALPQPRQSLLFSATLPMEIEKLAGEFLQNPVRVQIGSVTKPVDLVLQQFVRIGTREKLGQLLRHLQARQGSVLVFVKSKHGADRLAKQLKLAGCKAGALHGDLRQNRRRQVMAQFRAGELSVLVATDVAARGLDVTGLACVINYDLPQCAEDYIHRIGRTGRAGEVGVALSLVPAEDASKWKEICRVCRLGGLQELPANPLPVPQPKFSVGARKPRMAVQKVPDSSAPQRLDIHRPNPPKDPPQTLRPSTKKKAKPMSAAPALPPQASSARAGGFTIVKAGKAKTSLPSRHRVKASGNRPPHRFKRKKH